eukprot:TRINITY_DN2695_c0_g1_i1.p1 TRINITY_DN2695_c0_g1~~TRINITY_DN2695_c0_g1_i1.p1  ORF type:complete len:325 (+),score=30.40 TRINITY_DN2695_c0_g1_i1:89-1063(+)
MGVFNSRSNTKGWSEGYSTGFNKGWSSGQEDAMRESYMSSFEAGKVEGAIAGRHQGLQDGSALKYDQGHKEGFNVGLEWGNKHGFESGYQDAKNMLLYILGGLGSTAILCWFGYTIFKKRKHRRLSGTDPKPTQVSPLSRTWILDWYDAFIRSVHERSLPVPPGMLDIYFYTSREHYTSFRAHKVVLKTRSTFFEAFLKEEPTNSVLKLKAWSDRTTTEANNYLEAFYDILCWMYTNQLPTYPPKYTVQILEISHFCALNPLVTVCETVMINELDVGNLGQYMNLSDVYQLPRLLAACEKFMKHSLPRGDQINILKGFLEDPSQ